MILSHDANLGRMEFSERTGISLQDPAQVSLAQDDDVVDAFAPDRSDQSFGKAILPR